MRLRLMSMKEIIKPIIDASSGTTILIMPPDVKQDNHFAGSTNVHFIRKFDEFIWIVVELLMLSSQYYLTRKKSENLTFLVSTINAFSKTNRHLV